MTRRTPGVVKHKPRCPDCGAVMDARQGCYNCAVSTFCRATGIPEPCPEYSFDDRLDEPDYRFDFAWPEERLLLEIHGALWQRARDGVGYLGAHNTGPGRPRDMRKHLEATRRGWWVVEFEPADVFNGTAIAFIAALPQMQARRRSVES